MRQNYSISSDIAGIIELGFPVLISMHADILIPNYLGSIDFITSNYFILKEIQNRLCTDRKLIIYTVKNTVNLQQLIVKIVIIDIDF